MSGNDAAETTLQLFLWGKASHQEAGRQYYHSFSLNNHEYKIGDTVCLHPENEAQQPYLGQIDSCYTQTEPGGQGVAGTDSAAGQQHQMHCIQVRWFERLTNLDPRCKGTERERELVELMETDINPIGCVSCKANVFKASSYEEAAKLAKASQCAPNWYFCRGVYHQDTNQLVPYSKEQLTVFKVEPHRRNNRPRANSAMLEDVADSEDRRTNKRPRQQPLQPLQPLQQQDCQRLGSNNMHPALVPSIPMPLPVLEQAAAEVAHSGTNADQGAAMAAVTATAGSAGVSMVPAGGRRRGGHHSAAATAAARATGSTNTAAAANAAGANSGRACVECGATQTPQWREGPAGPKTLCNACGVRYGRQQNRAGKRCGGAGVSRNAAQSSGVRAGSGSKQGGSSSNGTKGNRQAQSAFEPMAQGRPIRQAAVLAANRTAEFARTGLYPEHGDPYAAAQANLPPVALPGVAPPGPTLPALAVPAASAPATDPLDFNLTAAAPLPTTMPHAGAPGHLYPTSPSPISHQQFAGNSGQECGSMAVGGRAVKMDSRGPFPAGALPVLPPQQLTSRESSHNSAESVQEVLGNMESFADMAKRMDLDFTSAGVGVDCTTPTMPRMDALKAEPDTADHTEGALLPCNLPGLGFLKPQEGALLGSPRTALLGLSAVISPCQDPDLGQSPTLAYASAAAAGSSAALLSAGSNVPPPQATPLLPPDSPAPALGALLNLPDLKVDTSGDAPSRAASNCDPVRSGKSVDLRQVAARAAQWVPSISKYSGVLSCIDEVSEQLPAPLMESLLNLGQAVDKAASEAAAAHAALAAVQQVLNTRQEAAARARSEAVAAVTRLRTMVTDLVDKHPQLGVQGGLHCQADMDACSGLLGLDDLDGMAGAALLQPCDADVPVSLNEGLDGYDAMLCSHGMAQPHALGPHGPHGPSDLEDLVTMEDAAMLGPHPCW